MFRLFSPIAEKNVLAMVVSIATPRSMCLMSLTSKVSLIKSMRMWSSLKPTSPRLVATFSIPSLRSINSTLIFFVSLSPKVSLINRLTQPKLSTLFLPALRILWRRTSRRRSFRDSMTARFTTIRYSSYLLLITC